MKLMVALFLLSTSAVALADVTLICKNNYKRLQLILSDAEYKHLMFGNNSLRSDKYFITTMKRSKEITLVDKNDSNIETGLYTCIPKF